MIRQAEIRVKTGSADDAYFREALGGGNSPDAFATVSVKLPRTNTMFTGRLELTRTDDRLTVYTVTREDS